jgi:hypothetical protein
MRTACPFGKTAAKKKARASCLSGDETLQGSTTTGVQGVSPICENRRILCTGRVESQPNILPQSN